MKYSILFLILVLACTKIGKEKPSIELNRVSYDERMFPPFALSSFDPRYNIIEVKEQDSLRGIPDTLSDVRIVHDFIDRDQYFYYSYKKGLMSEALFNRMRPPIDSLRQTQEWVDGIVSIIYGKNKDGEEVLIVDQNNNEDFSDDKVIDFKPRTVSFQEIEVDLHVAELNIDFEIFRDGKIKQESRPFALSYMSDEGFISLGLAYNEYLSGVWKTNSFSFDVALFESSFKAQHKTNPYTMLLIDFNRDGYFDSEDGSNEAYKTNEPFNISGITWEIDSLYSDGSAIQLVQSDTSVLPVTALRSGEKAPNFKAKTIDEKEIDLSDFRGKYVLIDFWGTWCGPCIDELPNLKKAYDKYHSRGFEIIGIATDDNPQKVKNFVENNDLEWLQIFEEHFSEDTKINKLYDVQGYPQQYLVGPDGLILNSGFEIRGENLLAKLEKLLGEN